MQLIMWKMEDCKNIKSVCMVTILQITCSLTKLMFLQNGEVLFWSTEAQRHPGAIELPWKRARVDPCIVNSNEVVLSILIWLKLRFVNGGFVTPSVRNRTKPPLNLPVSCCAQAHYNYSDMIPLGGKNRTSRAQIFSIVTLCLNSYIISTDEANIW